MFEEVAALDAFLETTDDPVVVLDTDDCLVRCNEAARTLTGTHDEWRGRSVASFFESFPQLVVHLQRVPNETGPVEITTDSGPRYFEITSASVGGSEPDSEADRRVVRLEDVTTAREREQELSRLEERYATLFQTEQLILWVQDFSEAKNYAERLAADVDDFEAYLEAHPEELEAIFDRVEVLEANEYALEFYGAESKAELEANLPALLTDEATRGMRKVWAGILEGERRFRKECVARSLDGKRRPELLEMTVPEDCADYSQVYTVTLDITERKRRERELADARDRYQRILNHFADYVLVCTEDGLVEYTSPSIERELGHTPDDVVGDDAVSYVHASDRADVRASIEEALNEPNSEPNVEYRVRTADGEYRWVEARIGNHLEDPLIEGILVTCRDVTERKRREEELRRTNELLDEFARVVSHDVATPLGVIQNKARLIEITGEESHAADIYDATERVQGLIDELESLARDGTQVGSVGTVDLERVATDAWTTVDAPGASLTVESSQTIEADRGRLRQLFENVFSNAVEHGSTGERTSAADAVEHAQSATTSERAVGVEIRVGVFPDGFYVADDGPGVPATDRDDVFEEGYTTDADGTGLGLAIVRRIAEAHGWTVSVTESESGGARFEIRTTASQSRESQSRESNPR